MDRRPLHDNQWLADVEAQLGVKRHRAVVKSCLHQPHTRVLAVGGAIHDRDHQAAPHATALSGGVDGDGTDTSNSRPLVKAVTADDSPAPFRDHAEKSRTVNMNEITSVATSTDGIGREVVMPI